MKESTEGAFKIFRFLPGERARIMRQRYFVSNRTPLWAHGYCCEVIKNNRYTVSVKIDGYEDEVHYIDTKDLVPLDYNTSHLA